MMSKVDQAPSDSESAILRKRAERYAAQIEVEVQQKIEVAVFRHGETRYAVPLHQLREIRPLVKPRYLPGVSKVVPGVCQIRGEIISLHDLSCLLGQARSDPADWVVIVESAEGGVGLLAHEIEAARELTGNSLGPVPLTFGAKARIFSGVDESGLFLLDVPALLSEPDFNTAC